MGVKEFTGPRTSLERAQEAAREIFEAQLRPLGLTARAIEGQDLDGLEASLSTINDAIANADSFGKIRIRAASGEAGFVIAKSDTSANFELGILPILLDRKALILDRMKALRSEEQLNNLRADVADEVDDQQAREQFLDIINRRFEEERLSAEKLSHERAKTEQERVDAWEKEQLIQIQIRERKWAIYRSFIERESMASIIGAILLLVLGAALVIATFTHTTPQEVVANAFLLILGYFFGQGVARSKDP
jgi:uncharacterized membrane protein